MMKCRLLLFLILLTGRLYSQDPVVEDSAAVYPENASFGNTYQTDSLLHAGYETHSTLYPKHFSPEFRNNYKGEEFTYTTVKPKESLWNRFWRKISRFLESIFGKPDTESAGAFAGAFLRIGAILISALVLYFLVRYLISKEGNFFFSKKNRKIPLESSDIEEDIHEINFPQRIAESERSGDFRMATRWLFLSFLKKLSDRNIITWHPEKTNGDYIREIKNPGTAEQFRQLALIFDHVWYGTFDITRQDYQYFKKKFESVNF